MSRPDFSRFYVRGDDGFLRFTVRSVFPSDPRFSFRSRFCAWTGSAAAGCYERLQCCSFLRGGSVVDQLTHNQQVAGSSPAVGSWVDGYSLKY